MADSPMGKFTHTKQYPMSEPKRSSTASGSNVKAATPGGRAAPSHVKASAAYPMQKASFFQGLCQNLMENYGLSQEDILSGIEGWHSGRAPCESMDEAAATLRAMLRLARQSGKDFVFRADGTMGLATAEGAQGDQQGEKVGDVEQLASESRLFEAEAVEMQLKPVVRCKLPVGDKREPMVETRCETMG